MSIVELDHSARPIDLSGRRNGPKRERLPLIPKFNAQEPFPTEKLGPVLSGAVKAIAEKIQVPEALAAQTVAAVATVAAQGVRDVRLPNGQTRPISNYFATIAQSGDRKTSADREALAAIRAHEQFLRDEHEKEFSEWKIKISAYQAEKRKIENSANLKFEERERKLRALGNEPVKPLDPILTISETTIEGLLKGWANMRAAIGIFSDEAGSFLAGYAMKEDQRVASAAALSHLWDGEHTRRMRAGDGLTMLYGRRLSMHLMCQPGVAESFLGDPLIQDQGLLARILIVGTESLAGTRMYRDVESDNGALQKFGKVINSLLSQKTVLAEGKRNELALPALEFSEDAKQAWIDFYNTVEHQTGPAGEFSEIRAFASKAAEHLARLAGVFAIIDDPKTMEISGDVMARSVEIMHWYLCEYLRLSGLSKIAPILKQAQALYDWMKAHPADKILFREIIQLGPRFARSKSATEPLILKLIEKGLKEEVS